jgi:hypothetical protein
MTLDPGDTVWIPCEVTHGIFPDERKVSIDSPEGRWAGFVNVTHLRERIMDGRTAIRATIVRAPHGKRAACLPGQTRHHQYLTITET